MLAYLVRRLLYALPILIGVNLITFALFFVVNTPDDMARMQLGVKRVTPDAIEKWKAERGYDKPLFVNGAASGAGVLTETIFFAKSVRMFVGDFGRAEDGRDIAREISARMGPSLAIALPTFVLGLFVTVAFALMLAFFRASYLDFWGVVLCVALMSISGLFYIIGGQYLISKVWKLVPISGYGGGVDAWKFLILPVLIGVVSGIGSSTRWYRTIFLEEIGKDYVRTARAKGLDGATIVVRHVLRNAMIPTVTVIGLQMGYLLGGSTVVERIFAWPGIGDLMLNAIGMRDYTLVQGIVVVYVAGFMLINLVVETLYQVINPRLRHA